MIWGVCESDYLVSSCVFLVFDGLDCFLRLEALPELLELGFLFLFG